MGGSSIPPSCDVAGLPEQHAPVFLPDEPLDDGGRHLASLFVYQFKNKYGFTPQKDIMVAFNDSDFAISVSPSETTTERQLFERLFIQEPDTFRFIQIHISNGVLVLTGTVDSYFEKALAVQVARRSVFQLDVADELQVNPSISRTLRSLNRIARHATSNS